MTSKSRVKGFNYEREIVKTFEGSCKFKNAKRAWGSNGESLGYHKEVDIKVNGKVVEQDLRLQCKRMKKLPKYLGLSEHVDATIFREDRGKSYILMTLNNFIKYI